MIQPWFFFVYYYFYPRPVAEANSYSNGMMSFFFLAENSAVFQKKKSWKRKKKGCVGSSRNLKREQGYSNNTVSLCSLLKPVEIESEILLHSCSSSSRRLVGSTDEACSCVPTSELHKYWLNDLVFFKIIPSQGLRSTKIK